MRCRVCGGTEGRSFSVGGKRYGDCPACACICLAEESLPSPAEEKRRYRLHRNDLGDPGYRRFLEGFIEAAVLPFATPGCAVLDFGSGPAPALASLLAERGFEVTCHDPFFAPGEDWRGRRWDLVILHEVAEHLHEPGEAFRLLVSLLAPGGRIAVRSRFVPADEEGFRRWWYREDPTHVAFYRPETFSWLARTHGLETLLAREPDLAVIGLPLSGPR